MTDLYGILLVDGLRKWIFKSWFIKLTDATACAKIQKQKHKCRVIIIRSVVEIADV